MSIKCKDCGFENEDGEKYCAMCNAELDLPKANAVSMDIPAPNPVGHQRENESMTIAQTETFKQPGAAIPHIVPGVKRYIVNCGNSRTKTIVNSPDITSYFCEGCREEHQIDGFFWVVEEEQLSEADNSVQHVMSPSVSENIGKGDTLVLEDIDTHVKIEIGSSGGTFGRYGTYGAAYLQSDPRGRMVSGEHCRFKYEYGRWSIEHLSRTNDTVYNGRKLEHGYEEAIRDGKIITLANVISFVVRIV